MWNKTKFLQIHVGNKTNMSRLKRNDYYTITDRVSRNQWSDVQFMGESDEGTLVFEDEQNELGGIEIPIHDLDRYHIEEETELNTHAVVHPPRMPSANRNLMSAFDAVSSQEPHYTSVFSLPWLNEDIYQQDMAEIRESADRIERELKRYKAMFGRKQTSRKKTKSFAKKSTTTKKKTKKSFVKKSTTTKKTKKSFAKKSTITKKKSSKTWKTSKKSKSSMKSPRK